MAVRLSSAVKCREHQACRRPGPCYVVPLSAPSPPAGSLTLQAPSLGSAPCARCLGTCSARSLTRARRYRRRTLSSSSSVSFDSSTYPLHTHTHGGCVHACSDAVMKPQRANFRLASDCKDVSIATRLDHEDGDTLGNPTHTLHGLLWLALLVCRYRPKLEPGPPGRCARVPALPGGWPSGRLPPRV